MRSLLRHLGWTGGAYGNLTVSESSQGGKGSDCDADGPEWLLIGSVTSSPPGKG